MKEAAYDFIFITQTRWDDVSSTSFSLAQEFAKTHRVFLIDKPYTWKDVLLKRTRQLKYRIGTYLTGKNRYRKLPNTPENLTLIIPAPVIPINWLPRGRIYNAMRKFNESRLHKSIRRASKDHSIEKFLVFNSFNPFYSLKFPSDIRPVATIYQSVDSIANARYLSKHGVYRELEVAREADLLLGTSKQICRYFKEQGMAIQYLPNAADVNPFIAAYEANTRRPPELESIKSPIIGYIGSIDDRLDFPLLDEIAKQNPDKTVVLVGPKRQSAEPTTSRNIVYIGLKPMSELPVYAKYMDCTIIPFRRNGFTQSIYPLKINEYLAAGRPVVVTPFSDEMEDFRGIVEVAETREQFIDAINRALATNTPQKEAQRMQYAKANSWQHRASRFWEIFHS